MGDVATPVNNPASTVNSIERKFVDIVLLGARTAARVYVPFLNFPVVSQIFDFLTSKFGDLIYNEIAIGSTFAIIDFQTEGEKSAFDDAMAALRASRLTGDPDAVSKARQAAKDNFDKLIHSDGSTP